MATQDPDLFASTPSDARRPAVAVTVIRSGGIAGITRRWSVQAPPLDPESWTALVADCPWDDAGDAGDARGADRFSWTVEAALPGIVHRAMLVESRAEGAWRTLIDAVREAADGAR